MDEVEFKKLIWDFYKQHGRDLPWRRANDPYAISISEVMLQQTQVARVIKQFPRFIEQFPNFTTLAAAAQRDVLAAWQGMGYNRRALWLSQAAKIVERDYGGRLPKDPIDLCTLPGIGPNTAGSIAAFAFNAPVVFIETNIRRVFIHHFFAGDEVVDDKQILPLVESTLDQDRPRQWYWALMDYGSSLAGLVANPNRRSKHYAKQSKFEGSNRQTRANVLRVLLMTPASIDQIAASLRQDVVVIHTVVNDLSHEGFVIAKSGVYRLVE